MQAYHEAGKLEFGVRNYQCSSGDTWRINERVYAAMLYGWRNGFELSGLIEDVSAEEDDIGPNLRNSSRSISGSLRGKMNWMRSGFWRFLSALRDQCRLRNWRIRFVGMRNSEAYHKGSSRASYCSRPPKANTQLLLMQQTASIRIRMRKSLIEERLERPSSARA